MNEITKQCKKCGEEKALTEFHKNKNGKHGVADTCKQCTNARINTWRENRYTEEELYSVAVTCATIKEFRTKFPKEYGSAGAQRLLPLLTDHMGRERGGFDPTKKGTFYVIAYTLHEETLIKIGITNRTTKERMREHGAYYHTPEILHEITADGYSIFELEKKMIKRYKKHKYTGHPIMESGNTELFHTPVLKTIFHHILAFKGK